MALEKAIQLRLSQAQWERWKLAAGDQALTTWVKVKIDEVCLGLDQPRFVVGVPDEPPAMIRTPEEARVAVPRAEAKPCRHGLPSCRICKTGRWVA